MLATLKFLILIMTLVRKVFFLAKDQSKILDVSYTPAGKDYSYCKFTIENDICEQDYSVSGQHSGGGFNKNYLKLTHPNGGENIYIGSDYLITWEGNSTL